jgi:hypothetical protein
MDCAKLEQGVFKITNNRFSLDSLLKEVHEIFEIQTKGKGININFTTDLGFGI